MSILYFADVPGRYEHFLLRGWDDFTDDVNTLYQRPVCEGGVFDSASRLCSVRKLFCRISSIVVIVVIDCSN